MQFNGLIFSSRAWAWERSSGAHRIATELRANGIDVEVVDFAAHWSLDDLKTLVKLRVNKNTIFFGFSTFFSYWNDTLEEFTTFLKTTYPNIKIILGGQHCLGIKSKNIDIWVDSYGETTMLEVVRSLTGNTPNNLKYDIFNFPGRKVIKALTSYPSYNLKSYSCVHEKRDFLEPWEWLTIEFARGCKFNCDFCNFPILGLKEDTSRSQEDFEREMRYNYDNWGVDRYYVADETFNDRVEKIRKFADVAERLEFKPFFSGFVRADLLATQKDSWEEMARLNFGGQYYGIESFNHASAKVVGKGMNPDKIKQCLIDYKQYMNTQGFYRGTISLIVGLPNETEESWNQTTQWLNQNWSDQSLVIFPLDIQDLNADSIHDYTNVSKFSQNLVKYGIRHLDKDKIRHDARSLDYYYDYKWREGNYAFNDFLWEHDTMNIFQARKFAYDYQDYYAQHFKFDSWQLAWPEMKLQKKLKFTDINMHQKRENAHISKKVTFDFINSYVEKKLSI